MVSVTGTTGPIDAVVAIATLNAESSASELAGDVRGYFSTPAQGLVSQVSSTSGPADTVAALEAFGLSSVELVATAGEADACWAEFTRTTPDSSSETIVMGVRTNADATIARIVLLAVPLVPGLAPARTETTPGVRARLQRYFDALQAEAWADAAAQFAENGYWSHPPYQGSPERELGHGRTEMADIFEHKRGPSPVQQVITDLWQSGNKVFIEGVVEGIPNGGSFVGTGRTNASGEIDRYVAFYSAERFV